MTRPRLLEKMKREREIVAKMPRLMSRFRIFSRSGDKGRLFKIRNNPCNYQIPPALYRASLKGSWLLITGGLAHQKNLLLAISFPYFLLFSSFFFFLLPPSPPPFFSIEGTRKKKKRSARRINEGHDKLRQATRKMPDFDPGEAARRNGKNQTKRVVGSTR